MNTIRKCSVSSAAILASLAVAGSARAQAPIAPSQSASYGFPVGEKSRLHTILNLGVGFDSNPDRQPSDGSLAPGRSTSDWKALIRPGLSLESPGTSVAFDLKTQLTIEQYFGASDIPADTTFGGTLGAKLRLGASTSPVSFQVADSLVRTGAYVDEAGSITSDERAFKEWFNHATAILVMKPGGGALEFDLGYEGSVSAFDDNARGQALLPFSQRHGALFDAKLRFLPKTSAVFHADFSWFGVGDESAGDSKDSTPYNVTLGLTGQVTPRIRTNLALGFGDALTWTDGLGSEVDASNKRTLIATVEGTYDIAEQSRFTLGYRRQVQPVIVLDNYSRDMVYARLQLGIGTRMLISMLAQYEARAYGAGDRDAQLITGDARVQYWFFDFLDAAVQYRALVQMSGTPDPLLLREFARHQVFAWVGLHY